MKFDLEVGFELTKAVLHEYQRELVWSWQANFLSSYDTCYEHIVQQKNIQRHIITQGTACINIDGGSNVHLTLS